MNESMIIGHMRGGGAGASLLGIATWKVATFATLRLNGKSCTIVLLFYR